MGIIMGSDTATNTQPAVSPGRWAQAVSRFNNSKTFYLNFVQYYVHLCVQNTNIYASSIYNPIKK